MKKKLPWIVFLIAFVMFFSNVEYAGSAPPEVTNPPGVSAPQVQNTDFGYLENITFEKIKGKERITIVVSKQSGVTIEALAGNAVVVKMAKMFVSEELKRPLGEGKLSNVINAVPSQKTIEGQNWALITIALRERVPYSVSQAGQNVVIDFNVSSIEGKMPAADQKPLETPAEITKKWTKPAEGQIIEKTTGAAKYAGRKISLDFQDAPIRAVLRLLAEEGGITIVSGDDVKGNMTVHMKKVPWDQALDTILDVHGLSKKQMGDVISVVTYERMKKDEADRKSGAEDRLKAEILSKKAEQERLEEKGKLRQVSIEAKIVEATDEFVRNLGVTWGGVYYGKAGDYSYALTAGTNTVQSRPITWGYPSAIPYQTTDGKTIQSAALNYPASVASPTFGLILGGANAVLEAQIQALETTNQGKIISSPKVTTMDNVKATIKQGEEVPYITIDKDGNRSITFKEAVLRLDVKPKITPDDTISMEIKATNDFADYSKAAQLNGNPPINKSEVESKIVVQDGDTIVIGGILKTSEQTGETGVPWLSKIPVLGWLFKTESTTKTRRQLMVFITPKIIKSDAVGEKSEKPKGGG
jgi:type IV pilus assembly protein PilQ